MESQNATISQTPNVLVLDREEGTLVPSTDVEMTVGSAAVITAGLKDLRANDFATANACGEKITTTEHSYTISDNNTGATLDISARRATVGVTTTTHQWSNISMPKALRAAFVLAGAMAPHIESALSDCLNAVADGADWEEAFEEVLGRKVSDERLERADSRVSEIRRETLQTRNGKQQATGVNTQ